MVYIRQILQTESKTMCSVVSFSDVHPHQEVVVTLD